MNYLIDTSGFVRILRRQVDQSWQDEVSRGFVVICEPVVTEAMAIVRPGDYARVLTALHNTYPWIAVPDNAWDTIRDLRAILAHHGIHQGLSVADYLVVVTALHHRLVLLHDDADFMTISTAIPEFREQRVTESRPTSR